MALERVPADIRAHGGVARMSDPGLILQIMDAVTIPVMAKCRIGHFVEAQILEAIGVDYIDESEVLTPADEAHHIYKHDFKIPFVCGCRNGDSADCEAAMIRTRVEAEQRYCRLHAPCAQTALRIRRVKSYGLCQNLAPYSFVIEARQRALAVLILRLVVAAPADAAVRAT
jgi:pyridoxal 5'-phosphate synthase pdxS subunit